MQSDGQVECNFASRLHDTLSSVATGRTQGPFDTDDASTLRIAALEGLGIIQLPLFSIIGDINDGRLVAVLPDIELPTTPLHVLNAFGRQLPVRAHLFIDFLLEKMNELKY